MDCGWHRFASEQSADLVVCRLSGSKRPAGKRGNRLSLGGGSLGWSTFYAVIFSSLPAAKVPESVPGAWLSKARIGSPQFKQLHSLRAWAARQS